jgi:hypothetical protein
MDAITLVALIVSLVALLIAVGQFLAQTVGTVDGYRRCQQSVLGDWTKYRKLDWSWSQFRYETIFKTPEIRLGPCHHRRNGTIALHGPLEWPPKTFWEYVQAFLSTLLFWRRWKKADENEDNMDLVCWVPLLDSLREMADPIAAILFTEDHLKNPKTPEKTPSWPCIRIKTHSWDLMPPDVVRPFATTTAGDVAILTCRMGVKWKVFKPIDGIMEGEGNGHVFSAARVRGLGTMLTYTKLTLDDGQDNSSSMESVRNPANGDPEMAPPTVEAKSVDNSRNPQMRYIWTPAADMFWFGIIPGNSELSLPSFPVGTNEEVFATLWKIDPGGRAADSLQKTQNKQRDYLHGFADIVPMVSPWLCQMSDPVLNWYPRPMRSTLGLTWFFAAYKIFEGKLNQWIFEHSNSTHLDMAKWVHNRYEELQKNWGREWDGISEGLDLRTPEFYCDLNTLYDDTTRYFLELNQSGRLRYMDLVCAHLREAPRSFVDSLWALDNNIDVEKTNPADDKKWRAGAMGFYWKYLPDYVEYMKGNGCDDKDLVEVAWIVLVFRAMLWMRAHIPKTDIPLLPSQYHGSRLPIYLG